MLKHWKLLIDFVENIAQHEKRGRTGLLMCYVHNACLSLRG